MGDFLHMDTDIVEPVMRGLTGTGDDLDGGWRSCREQVDSGEAGIGQDPLGQAFRGGYESASRALRTSADELPRSLRTAAENGMTCCTEYAAADARAAAGLPGNRST
ncbi:hypothetical protein AB0M20_08595 [Actinoplanes sp. NPDC051633]|uniref:hypothetical protein n=1 Tax=Actinoplanes sp. NPDC051633 TaxID=3155670 RepID=UPI00343A8EAE